MWRCGMLAIAFAKSTQCNCLCQELQGGFSRDSHCSSSWGPLRSLAASCCCSGCQGGPRALRSQLAKWLRKGRP